MTIPKTILTIPDTHVPYHCPKTWATILRAIKRKKPELVVIIGDFADFYAVSSFPKDPARKANLVYEVACVNRELCKVQDLMDSKVIFVAGNHEARLQSYVTQKAPELFGLVNIPKLFKLKERGWDYVPYRSHTHVGKLAFSHDVGYSGKSAAQQSLAAFQGNLVFGHTHRGEVVYGGTVKGEHRVCMNVGWAGDLDQIDYMHKSATKDWQHGFGWADMDVKGNAWLSFVPILGGTCCVAGTWI